MSEVTVKQLADSVGTPVDKLLTQMKAAGLSQKKESDSVSDDEKQKLLNHLKTSHGDKADAPKKITLKRKVTTTLKTGGSKNKTVSIEVRKKRTYVKRDESAAPAAAQAPKVEDDRTAKRAEEDAKLEAARLKAAQEKAGEHLVVVSDDTSRFLWNQ